MRTIIVRSKNNSIAIITIGLFMFSSPSFADDQSLTKINNFITKQNIQKKKYTLKAKFSEKNSRDLERFKVLNLSWKHLKKIIKNRFDWSIESEFHLWKQNSKPFTDILLYQGTKHLSSFNPEKIRVDYEDRYLGNPILPSLKLVFSKTTVSNASSGENTTEKKLFLLRPNKSLVSKGLKSKALIKSDNSLNVSSAPWREKDNLYLAGRTLALNFDSTWRYASDFPYTVFQRRFHKTLIPIDNIKLVFKNKLPAEILEGTVCNIRIAYSGSSETLHVIPFNTRGPNFISWTNESTLQLDLSNIKSKALKIGEIPLLKEMIIFYPGDLQSIIRERPLETILFHEQGGFDSIEYLPLVPWEKKNITYLLKKELGLPLISKWRYSQDNENARFERKFHKDLSHVKAIDILLNSNVLPNSNQLNCQIRLGFRERRMPSEIIPCSDLSYNIFNDDEKHTLRIQINDLVNQRYDEGKEKIFLEELTVYLPGVANNYVKNNLLERVLFHNFSPYYEQNITEQFPITASSQNLVTSVVTLDGLSNFQFLSQSFKRIVFDLRKVLFIIGPKFKLEAMAISFSPLTTDEPSGARIQAVDSFIPLSSHVSPLLAPVNKLNKRWGGPFPNFNETQEKTQLIQVNAYSPYEVFDKGNPYVSGRSSMHGVSIQSFQNTLHSISNKNDGTNLKLLFLKKERFANFSIPSIGPFKSDRVVSIDWEINGPIRVEPTNSKKIWISNSKEIKYLLPRGALPKFKINIKKNTLIDAVSGNSSSILLKQVHVHGEKFLRVVLNKKQQFFPGYESSQNSLEKIHITERKVPHPIKPTSSKKLIPHNDISGMTGGNILSPNSKKQPLLNKVLEGLSSSHISSWSYQNKADLSNPSYIDLLLDVSLGPEPLKSIDCNLQFKLNNFSPLIKNINCLDQPFILMESQGMSFSFAKVIPDMRKQQNFITTGNIKIQTVGEPIRWRNINGGLLLLGNGDSIDIHWKENLKLEKESRFYLRIPDGAESIISAEITPFSGKQALETIPILLNYPSKLGLNNKQINRFKIHLKLRKNKDFSLLLNEMVLFTPVSVNKDQGIFLPSILSTNFPLKPTSFQSISPSEVTIKKNQLSAAVLTRRSGSETFNWTTKVNKKTTNLRWIKIKHLASPSIHASNPCWIELVLLGSNQKINQTVCTNHSDGQVLVPISEHFTDDIVRSLAWTVHIDNQKNLLPLIVNFNLTMSIIKNTHIVQEDIQNIPLLEIKGQRAPPIFNLTAKGVNPREKWFDIKIDPVDSSVFNMQGISFLDHPYLNVDSILGENSLPTSIEDWEYVLKNEPLVFNLRQSPWLNISFKLLLISGFILVIVFLLNKFKWQVVWQFLKRKNFTLESYHQFISVSPKKLFSIIFNNISLFNRLIGLVLTAILIFKDYNLLDHNFISLALILAGVLWHELRKNIIYNNLSNIPLVPLFFGKNNKIPTLLHSFLIAITAWTIIQIAHSNSSFIDFLGPIMSVAYFYLPWSTKLFRPVNVDRNQLFIFWLAIAFGIYFISIVALLSGVSFSIFLNTLSFGNLVIIPIWYYFIKKIQPEIKSHWPGLAEKVYAGESSRFIAGFIVLLGLTTISRILNLILLAEQFAIIGLYLLTVGIIVKIIESHQTKHNSPQTDAHDSTEKKFSAS